MQGQAYCSRLFSIEQELAELPPEEQYTQRLERSKPVMDALLAWAETTNAAPKSALGKAIYYLKEQWPYLIRVLVTAYEFYREIFPVGSFERKGVYEDQKGNGIAVTIPPKGTKGSKGGENGITLEIEGDGRAKRYTITDDLATLPDLQDTDFTIMPRSPTSATGAAEKMPGFCMPWSLIWTVWGCRSSGTRCIKWRAVFYTQGHLCGEQRNRPAPVLCPG